MASKVESITAKLTAAQALVNKYTAELAALDRANNIAVGSIVTFSFGRAEKKVELTGKVLASGTQDNGVAVVSVLLNEGTIDADIKRIPVSTITVVAGTPTDSTFVQADISPVGELNPIGVSTDPLGCVVSSEPVVAGDPLAGINDSQSVDALIS